MAAVSGILQLLSSFNFNKSFGNLGTPSIGVAFPSINQSFAAGAGAGAYNNCYAGTRSVVSGTPDVLNLTSGLTNPDGATAAFTDVVLIIIKNNGTAGQTLSVGGGTNDVTTIWGSTGIEAIPPGGTMLALNPAAAGFGITASTADKLQITCASGTASYDILIVGH